MRHLNITKKTIICSLVIVGVIIIPLLYSVFYLGAFWDPYSKLQELPVAVVNLDAGAQINGEERNIGKELCAQLNDDPKLKYMFTDEGDALSGTKEDQYYAMITIPKNFSSRIASAGTTNKMTAAITFTANEKRNYLAAQILKNAVEQIKVSLTGKVDAQIVSQLCDQLRETPKKLDTLETGLDTLVNGSSKLSAGAKQLSVGSGALKSGMSIFQSSLGAYSDGATSVESGSARLLLGAKALDDGIDALVNGSTELKEAAANINDLKTSAELLATKTGQFNTGLQAYTQGVDALIGSAEQTGNFLKGYVSANPQLMADPTFSQFMASISDPKNAQNIGALKQYTSALKEASTQLAQGTAQLSEATAGIPELKDGIEKINAGLLSAQSGSSQIVTGAGCLQSGISVLVSGSSQLDAAGSKLADGAIKMNSGASTLSDGTDSLSKGIQLARNSVISANTKAKTQLALLDGLDAYTETPVSTTVEPVDAVPNYGTAFAPYFLSLSLWVGALIIFFAIYLDADGKFNLLSRNSDNKLLRSFAYLLIGLIQAIFLGILLKVVLGLTIQHLFLYYAACCLVSLVFISIVQFLLVFLKDIGKFLSIALLILQLTSCGGTFPMETVPKFFQIMYPFMPMTYSVGLLKEAISSTSDTDAGFNLLVLGGILIVFMTLTVIFSVARKTRTSGAESKTEGSGAGAPVILVSPKAL
jgi:putative membrane protein